VIQETNSFGAWLAKEINQAFVHKGAQAPLIIWCDPERSWKDLLLAVTQDNDIQLWAEDVHELLVREWLYKAAGNPCVVWLPVAREEITYCKVFELQAAEVIEWTIPEALAAYGVEIPDEYKTELEPLLASHARQWLFRPPSAWQELTPRGARHSLVDDDLILEVLATPGMSFTRMIDDRLFAVFSQRVTKDFGLPEPYEDKPENWRLEALAALLCTEAAAKYPSCPPGDDERIIPEGPTRNKALKLLDRWQRDLQLITYFEDLAIQADRLTSLQYWARHLPDIPAPLASPAAEMSFFQREVEHLAAMDDYDTMIAYLDSRYGIYRSHSSGYWGQYATNQNRVRWSYLTRIAGVASTLYQQVDTEKAWMSPADAVAWFTGGGWQLDQAGEIIFQEDSGVPGGLVGVRAGLRKAYLRRLDQVNTVFSDLLDRSKEENLFLPFAGDAVRDLVEKASGRDPVAVLVLDACRFDLGCRLAEILNQGEPVERVEVKAARAPLPSITALGMPYCLPLASANLQVELGAGAVWSVTVDGFKGDLTRADKRREWLKKTFKLKDKSIMSDHDVLDAGEISAQNLGKLLFVFGDVFDKEGHEGQLKLTGSEEHLERYGRIIRRLRSGGYTTVIVLTDHGFFHWIPETDEIEPAPEGDVCWTSRRAVTGYGLKHPAAVGLKVTGSEMECLVPRSVNAFKTYGGLGYFHGGATLQELVIPVLIARWPRKGKKVGVVLKPVDKITSLVQRVEFVPAASQNNLFGQADDNLLGREVEIKVVDPESNRLIFKGKENKRVKPGGEPDVIELEKIAGAEASYNTRLMLRLLDADNDEILDEKPVVLRIELDDWD